MPKRSESPDVDLSESDVCGNCPNPSVDEDGDWVCQEAPGFCSKPCQDQYMVCVGEQMAAEAAELEYEKYLAEQGLPLVEECTGACQHTRMTLQGGYTQSDGLVHLDLLCDDCGTSGSTTVSYDEVLW